MKKLTLTKESLRNLKPEESANVQGGLYATMFKCETDDIFCQSVATCPGNSFFSCDQGPSVDFC